MVVTEILLALSLENQDGSHGTSPHRYSTESSLLGFPHLGQDMVCDRYSTSPCSSDCKNCYDFRCLCLE